MIPMSSTLPELSEVPEIVHSRQEIIPQDKKKYQHKPSNTNFRQQRLDASTPLLTPRVVTFAFLIIGIVFIPVGVSMVYLSDTVVEYEIRYDDICSEGQYCNLPITLPKMDPPVYMFYRLTNFYQNHRRYVSSRDPQQLVGLPVSSYSQLKLSCDPYISLDGGQDADKFYLPCGLMARSVFNDTYYLSQTTVENGLVNNTPIGLIKKGISWSQDNGLFKNPSQKAPGIRVVSNFEDEDFVVWMKPSPFPDFRKTYRKIDVALNGNYTLEIESNFPAKILNSEKYVIFSTSSAIGGKNDIIGWLYIVCGGLLIFQAIAFGIQQLCCPRKWADERYLEWNKNK